jgi:ribosome-associated protein
MNPVRYEQRSAFLSSEPKGRKAKPAPASATKAKAAKVKSATSAAKKPVKASAAKPAKASPKAKATPKTRAAPKAKAAKEKAAPKTSNIQTPREKAAAAKEIADRKKATAMLKLVMTSLDDDKAEDIVSIDLAGKTPIADYMVVASGRSARHVGAVADHLVRRLKEEGYGHAQVEGMTQGDWVLIDAGDVVIHVFRPEVRQFYRLEKMWAADIPADQIAV